MAHDDVTVATLIGRERERATLDRLLASLRAGQSRALVVRAEAGMGKTALLDHLCRVAHGCRVTRAAGVESERELAFAGLHQLCAPSLGLVDTLPGPQADALRVAFGLRDGAAPEPFMVGLAVLGLLAAAAEEQPLVCVVDDAQWLDLASIQVLAFVARRLVAESVALVFAVREPDPTDSLAGVEDLVLSGLADDDARTVLDRALSYSVDPSVRERVLAEARGNPLALLELPHQLTPAEIAGGYRLSGAPVVGRIEQSFARRIDALPDRTRRLLLLAACEPGGDPLLVLAAAAEVGLSADDLAPAAEDGLVQLGRHLAFRHPLVRSAAYHSASPGERREAHRALADVTDPVRDPDRRAWHRAEATAGLDEEVAAELAASARRAQARGGVAAGAAFHQRSAELTPDPNLRARRALMAAEDKYLAGAADDALGLLAVADAGPLDDHQQARATLVRAHVAYAVTRGGRSAGLLLDAAQRMSEHDPVVALSTYVDALVAAIGAGRLVEGSGIAEVADAIIGGSSPHPLPTGARPACDALRAMAVLVRDGYQEAGPALLGSLAALRGAELTRDEALRWLPLGCLVARTLADDRAYDELTGRYLQVARETGAVHALPQAMAERVSSLLFAGDLVGAAALADEVSTLLQASGVPRSMTRRGWLASFRGDRDTATSLIEEIRADTLRRGEGQWLIAIGWQLALLQNGLGRYEEALVATDGILGHPFDIGIAQWALPERVEAAVRCDRPEVAREALDDLVALARSSGADWALGVAAAARALVADDGAAEPLYREALERLNRTRMQAPLARAHLVYGEWLRRANRRADARDHLRTAHESFADMGMHAYAERARRELLATGESARRRSVETLDDLTAQERQIAQLAAQGATNPEIAAQLFLSPRTVEWHLRKVFAKLQITSRKQLHEALGPARHVGGATR